jgi:hypothetical protein
MSLIDGNAGTELVCNKLREAGFQLEEKELGFEEREYWEYHIYSAGVLFNSQEELDTKLGNMISRLERYPIPNKQLYKCQVSTWPKNRYGEHILVHCYYLKGSSLAAPQTREEEEESKA